MTEFLFDDYCVYHVGNEMKDLPWEISKLLHRNSSTSIHITEIPQFICINVDK